MKRTEMERIEREMRRREKANQRVAGGAAGAGAGASVGEYIERLFALFRYDEAEIFNAREDVNVLEVLEAMKADLPQKKWEDVLRKAIKKTGVKERDRAFQELSALMGAMEPSAN
ncbi:MAG: hypothetical protein K1X75_16205 [Leptospirales bacterium]|nr:hypothetical protein [Leptospirales bacterium]